jgi:phosphoglycerate dehydrogenase-like enzyme
MRVLSVRSCDGRAGLLAMLGHCDYVSLHVPLSERTRGLMDAEALAAMKLGARLINCARGGVVDQRALEDALGSGHLGGAGLDVHWQEPADAKAALYLRDDVVALPHVAGSTEESFARLVAVVAENIRRLSEGEELLHRVA